MSLVAPKVRPPASGERSHEGVPGSGRWGRRTMPYVFISPFYVLFALFSLIPLGYAAYLSVFTSTLTGSNIFVGFRNYVTLFHTGAFWSGMLGVFVLGAIQVPVMLVIALFLAISLDLGIMKFGKTFRLVYFLPFAVPGVVSAIMWGYMLSPNLSPLDSISKALGLGAANFLSNTLIWPVLGNILTWELVGYNMLIQYTALQALPSELNEAAVVDGANLWQIVRHIRVPLIRGAILLSGLFSVIGTLQLFTEPQLMMTLTSAISSHFTPNLFLYTAAFSGQQVNIAAAGALILGAAIVGASLLVYGGVRRSGRAKV